MTARPSDLLRAAKALIDEPGKWCKGRLADGDGRRSAMGALLVAVGRNRKLFNATYRYLYAAAVNAGGESIDTYNDAPTTTHADVMRLYDEAIQAAERDEAGQPERRG